MPAAGLVNASVRLEFALRQLHLGMPFLAVRLSHPDQRHSRLQREVVGDTGHGFARSGFHSRPQVITAGVPKRVPSDVPAHALAPGIRAHETLQHPQDSRPFRIRDRIEGLVQLIGRQDVLDDGVCADQCIQPDRGLA